MNDNETSYLKRDLITLGIIAVVVIALVAALWYFESTQQFFSHLAERYLSFSQPS